MRKLLCSLLTVALILSACSDDNKNGFSPNQELVLGTYIAAQKIGNTTGEGVMLSSESYIVLENTFTGTLYNKKTNITTPFEWTMNKDESINMFIGQQVLTGLATDREEDIVKYKELLIKDVDNDLSYIFVKADVPPLSWTSVDTGNKATAASVSMNNNNMLVSVHQDIETGELIAKLGFKKTQGTIEWLAESEKNIGKGVNPAVSINDFPYLIITYNNKETGELMYIAGNPDRETYAMTWGEPNLLGIDGDRVSLKLHPSNTSLVILTEKNESIEYRSGTYTNFNRTIRVNVTVGNLTAKGVNPDIAINEEGKIMAIYDANGELRLHTAQFGTKPEEVVWSEAQLIGNGHLPAISINRRDDVAISYRLKGLPYAAYRLGEIKDNRMNTTSQAVLGLENSENIVLTNMGYILNAKIDKGGLSLISDRILDYSNAWMTKLPDNTLLSAISMPGTHDAGARYGGNTAQCQTLFIKEQLDAGVRFLDVRLKIVGGELKVYHGISNQFQKFDQVLNDCYTFLNENVGETIVMSIMNEASSEAIIPTFEKAVYDATDKQTSKWAFSNTIPALGSVRGKIVLFRRFPSAEGESKGRGIPAGRGWSDDAVFELGALSIQDKYNTSAVKVETEKWPLAKAHFEKAIAGEDKIAYINFLSATGGFSTSPREVALGSNRVEKGMIAFTDEYMASNIGKKRLGWILYDFPSYKAINSVIASNF